MGMGARTCRQRQPIRSRRTVLHPAEPPDHFPLPAAGKCLGRSAADLLLIWRRAGHDGPHHPARAGCPAPDLCRRRQPVCHPGRPPHAGRAAQCRWTPVGPSHRHSHSPAGGQDRPAHFWHHRPRYSACAATRADGPCPGSRLRRAAAQGPPQTGPLRGTSGTAGD